MPSHTGAVKENDGPEIRPGGDMHIIKYTITLSKNGTSPPSLRRRERYFAVLTQPPSINRKERKQAERKGRKEGDEEREGNRKKQRKREKERKTKEMKGGREKEGKHSV